MYEQYYCISTLLFPKERVAMKPLLSENLIGLQNHAILQFLGFQINDSVQFKLTKKKQNYENIQKTHRGKVDLEQKRTSLCMLMSWSIRFVQPTRLLIELFVLFFCSGTVDFSWSYGPSHLPKKTTSNQELLPLQRRVQLSPLLFLGLVCYFVFYSILLINSGDWLVLCVHI